MRSFSLLIKPAGADCNLVCPYCFYADKADRFAGGACRMSDEVLERLVRDYMGLGFGVSGFAFQGGEPTLMGLSFYKKLVELQKKYGVSGQVVSNALQTNGVLLDSEWCEFLSKYKFLVGISLDGPREIHDRYRIDRRGVGCFDKVAGAIENCRKYGVEFNILTLLTDANVGKCDELFDFYVEQGIDYLQFIPCVEKDPATGEIAEFSITAEQYGDFLCRLFDRWVEYGPAKLSVRMFESMLSYHLGRGPTVCTFGMRCSDYVVVEHNGDVFCCDFFVDDERRLGNLLDEPIGQLAGSRAKRDFAAEKMKICNKCLVCRFLPVCRGGCLKNRIVLNDNFASCDYFCAGYKRFFEYTEGKFEQIAAEVAKIK